MTQTAFEPSDGAAFAVALLNTWDELEPDPECLRDVGVAQRLLTRHGLADAARVARAADVDWLRGLRERARWGVGCGKRGDRRCGAEHDPRRSERAAVARAGHGRRRRSFATTGPARLCGSSATRSLLARCSRRSRTADAGSDSVAATRGRAAASSSIGPAGAVRRDRCRLCADRAAHQAFRRRLLVPNFAPVISSIAFDV